MSGFCDVPRDATERELMVNGWVDWVLRRTDSTGFVASGDVVERAARAAAEMIVPPVPGSEPEPPAAPYSSARDGIQAAHALLMEEQFEAAKLEVLRAEVRLAELQVAQIRSRRQ